MGPILVVIDTRKQTMARYVGRCCTHKALAEGDAWRLRVEQFRTNPEMFDDAGPPEAA